MGVNPTFLEVGVLTLLDITPSLHHLHITQHEVLHCRSRPRRHFGLGQPRRSFGTCSGSHDPLVRVSYGQGLRETDPGAPQADSVDTVLADLKARTDGAFFHAGPDRVLRAVSTDFEVVGTAALSERQAAEWHASLDQPLAKRAVVDEREILDNMSVHIRSNAAEADVFNLEARQSCPTLCGTSGCPSGVRFCLTPC